MNRKQNLHIQKYIKMRLTSKDRMSHIHYTINRDDLEFCFEFVGMFSLNLLCNSTPMSYSFSTGRVSCGCGTNECEHRVTLMKYFEELVTK